MSNKRVEWSKLVLNFLRLVLLLLCVTLSGNALAQSAPPAPSVALGWDPETNTMVVGYKLYIGNGPRSYYAVLDVGNNTSGYLSGIQPGTNYFFAVTSYAADGTESDPSPDLIVSVVPAFFAGEQLVDTNGLRYLQFSDGVSFGYFGFVGYPWLYHFDMGYEYVFPSTDGSGGIYFYDDSSGSFWYTSPAIFPYLYDFTLNAWLYYYPDETNSGHYTSNPRYFYNFGTLQIITK